MTNNILLVFQNPCLMPAAVGWVSSQIIKVLLNLMLLRRLDVTRFVGAGGMPPAPSALFTAPAASKCRNSSPNTWGWPKMASTSARTSP